MRSFSISLQSRHTFIPADRQQLPASIQAIGKTPVPCIEQGSMNIEHFSFGLCYSINNLIDNSVSKNEELAE